MPQEVYQHTFANGLTLLAERMEHVRSAALNFLVPAGCVYDPPDRLGIASVLSDLITRGAGDRDSRELTLALDNLGLDRTRASAACTCASGARRWPATCPPPWKSTPTSCAGRTCPKTRWTPSRSLALQDLHGLEDEPRPKVLDRAAQAGTTRRRSATTAAAPPRASTA